MRMETITIFISASKIKTGKSTIAHKIMECLVKEGLTVEVRDEPLEIKRVHNLLNNGCAAIKDKTKIIIETQDYRQHYKGGK